MSKCTDKMIKSTPFHRVADDSYGHYFKDSENMSGISDFKIKPFQSSVAFYDAMFLDVSIIPFN